MKEISIAHNEVDDISVTAVAERLRIAGYNVIVGPKRINGFDSYSSNKSYIKRSNFAHIIFISRDLYRSYPDIITSFSDAINHDYQNIIIISSDDDWSAIKDPRLQTIKSISYVHASDPKLFETIHAALPNGNDFSHMRKDRVLEILASSYDDLKDSLHVNEQGGRIEYSILDFIHRTTSEIERYIIVYHKSSHEAVYDHIKYNYPQKLSSDARIFVIRTEPSYELSVRQKENTRSLFGASALRFETLVSKRKLRTAPPPKLTDSNEFVIPQTWTTIQNGKINTISTDKLITACVTSTDTDTQRQIVILSGAGGAGKTHFVRFLNDRFIQTGSDVFFLSASSIINTQRDQYIESLYDIYRLSCAEDVGHRDETKLLFDTKFLIGNINVIVDGLEEIITMMGDRFILDKFYNDCIDKITSNANGRIFITTRENFTPEAIDDYATRYEVSLFSRNQARDYFDSAFGVSTEKSVLSFKIFSELVDGGQVAPPLFCTLIANEIDKADDHQRITERLSKGEFRSSKGIDEFIRTIVSRETKLGIEWPVDNTLFTLEQLAMRSIKGPFSINEATDIISKSIDLSAFGATGNLKEATRNFFFLTYNKETDTVTFRYEFLRTIFLAAFLYRQISEGDIDLSDDTIRDVLYRQLFPGSSVIGRIAIQASTLGAGPVGEILELLVQDVSAGKVIVEPKHIASVISSNLLFLRLVLLGSNADRDTYTNVLKNVFCNKHDGNHIINLSMINFSQDSSVRLRFNVEGIIFKECYFIGSHIDVLFRADNTTKFIDCKVERGLSEAPTANASVFSANWVNDGMLDRAFRDMLFKSTDINELSREQKMNEIARFLRLFMQVQRFSLNRNLHVISGMFKGQQGIGASKMIDVLSKKGIIEEMPGRGGFIQISASHRPDVRRFIMDKIISRRIEECIGEL